MCFLQHTSHSAEVNDITAAFTRTDKGTLMDNIASIGLTLLFSAILSLQCTKLNQETLNQICTFSKGYSFLFLFTHEAIMGLHFDFETSWFYCLLPTSDSALFVFDCLLPSDDTVQKQNCWRRRQRWIKEAVMPGRSVGFGEGDGLTAGLCRSTWSPTNSMGKTPNSTETETWVNDVFNDHFAGIVQRNKTWCITC